MLDFMSSALLGRFVNRTYSTRRRAVTTRAKEDQPCAAGKRKPAKK